MERSRVCTLFFIVFCLQFRGYRAPNACDFPLHLVHTWPFGEGLFSYEMKTQSWSGDHSNIGYNSGPSSLGYNAVEFNASAKSYIEFPVQDSIIPGTDYAISFYLFVESDGAFLHYKSDDYGNDTGMIESFKFEVIEGNIRATLFSNNSEVDATISTGITYNTWTPIVYQRDYSNQKIKFDGPGGVKEHNAFGAVIKNVDTSFPGILRFGGSIDEESYFSGRVACVQMINCKDPLLNGSYTAECAEATTTTRATTESSTTTHAVTTTTSTPTDMPTTITTMPTYTTTTPTITTTTVITTKTTVPLTTAISATPFSKCMRYKRVNENVNFSNGQALDILMNVVSPLACSAKCSRHGSCWSFVFKPGGSCWLGPSSPGTMEDTDAVLYQVV